MQQQRNISLMRDFAVIVVFAVLTGCCWSSWAAPTTSIPPLSTPSSSPVATYDQSQRGENNLHLSFNNFNVVSVLEGAGHLGDIMGLVPWPSVQDYDYNYDYPDYMNETDGLNSTSSSITSSRPPNATLASPPEISIAKQPHRCGPGLKKNGRGKCVRRPFYRFPFGLRMGSRFKSREPPSW